MSRPPCSGRSGRARSGSTDPSHRPRSATCRLAIRCGPLRELHQTWRGHGPARAPANGLKENGLPSRNHVATMAATIFAAGALALPGAASADATATLDAGTKTLTVQGDGASDTFAVDLTDPSL